MKCPVDNTTLSIADRQGIEIDYCPTCRGVWLDRGELDNLIKRSNQLDDQRSEYREDRHDYRDRDDEHESRGRSYDDHHGKHHKKESFLGEIFDF